MRSLVLTLALAAGAVSGAATTSLVDRLKAEGFTCRSEKNGDVCSVDSVSRGNFLRYSQPVAILIPSGLDRPSRMILHLHGFRDPETRAQDRNLTSMLNTFQFLDRLKEAKIKDAVLIFPLSVGRCDTFNTQLVSQFEAFRTWARIAVEATQDDWVITGHSGANTAIQAILSKAAANGAAGQSFLNHLKAVAYFDASYSSTTAAFQQALKVNPNIQIYSVYRAGTQTQSGSQLMAKNLASYHPTVFAASSRDGAGALDHWGLVRLYYPKILLRIDGRSQAQSQVAPFIKSLPSTDALESKEIY